MGKKIGAMIFLVILLIGAYAYADYYVINSKDGITTKTTYLDNQNIRVEISNARTFAPPKQEENLAESGGFNIKSVLLGFLDKLGFVGTTLYQNTGGSSGQDGYAFQSAPKEVGITADFAFGSPSGPLTRRFIYRLNDQEVSITADQWQNLSTSAKWGIGIGLGLGLGAGIWGITELFDTHPDHKKDKDDDDDGGGGPVCGNGICEDGEVETCPRDCPN